MPLVGIIASKRDIQAIKIGTEDRNMEFVAITPQSIKNVKNIKFEEIIFLEDINLKEEEYIYMEEIILKSKYIIINGDIDINILKKIRIEKMIKLITFGLNSKNTITVSSVKEDKIIVCIQRDIEKEDGKIIERQEKEILLDNLKNKKIYNNLIIFILKELHN